MIVMIKLENYSLYYAYPNVVQLVLVYSVLSRRKRRKLRPRIWFVAAVALL